MSETRKQIEQLRSFLQHVDECLHEAVFEVGWSLDALDELDRESKEDQSRERPKPCPKCGVSSDCGFHLRGCPEPWRRDSEPVEDQSREQKIEITEKMVERAHAAYQQGAIMRTGTPRDWTHAALEAAFAEIGDQSREQGVEVTDEMVKRAAAEFFYWAKRDPDSPSGYEPAMRKALEVALSDA